MYSLRSTVLIRVFLVSSVCLICLFFVVIVVIFACYFFIMYTLLPVSLDFSFWISPSNYYALY